MIDRSFFAAAMLPVGVAIGGGLIGWGFARGRAAEDSAVVATVQYLLD